MRISAPGRKEMQLRAMDKKDHKMEEVHSSMTDRAAVPTPSASGADEPGQFSRRELISRYSKYAMTSAPLLVFISHRRQVKSKP